MTERGQYSSVVLDYFNGPRHAGDPDPDAGHIVRASVSAGGAGPRITLTGAASDRDVWTLLTWRVFGCPHTMAAAEAACRRFTGAKTTAPAEFAFVELVEELGIPIEKTGRVLLVEDAFRALDAARAAALENTT